MSSPYIGEIRMFGGSFPPNGWAFCDGQPIPISENDALFVLIGTTYGGDGEETFQLPNLQSRIPIHQGTGADGINYQMGESAGVESVTLTTQQIPVHNHATQCQTVAGTQSTPTNNVWANSTLNQFNVNPPNAQMNAQAIVPAGGSQPHDNMMPFLVVSFIISLFGIFPSN
jgi:microcystin-dependent protein